MATTLLACGGDQPQGESARPVAIRARITHHASIKSLGTDTLSDFARISELSIDPGGDAIVTIVQDPEQNVSAALVITSNQAKRSALLWPDSVTAAWWLAPHKLAFTTQTGAGIRIIVDVHAADLVFADTTPIGGSADIRSWTPDSSLTTQIQSYVDSVYAQVGSAPQTSTLTYGVTRYLPDLTDSLIAFHITGSIRGGAENNPAWFVIGRSSTGVTRIDHLVGPVIEMPAQAAAWGEGTTFYYAKGQVIWQAIIDQTGRTTPQRE